jgi:hypothetical protein
LYRRKKEGFEGLRVVSFQGLIDSCLWAFCSNGEQNEGLFKNQKKSDSFIEHCVPAYPAYPRMLPRVSEPFMCRNVGEGELNAAGGTAERPVRRPGH